MEDIKHTKKCKECQAEKELVEFHSHPNTKDRKSHKCKSCLREYALANKARINEKNKIWRENNKGKLNTYNKEYYKQNKEKAKFNKQRHREENKEYYSEYNKKHYQENKDKYKESAKKYYEQNKEKQKEYGKEHYQENKEHYAEYYKEKYNSDPDFKLAKIIRSFCFRVTNAVKEDKELRSLEYLGCSLAEFKAHIESQWQEGMTWENHSKDGWHIDHIKPLDWFIKNSDDPWQANHYLNLQPLWAEENLSKSNKF